MAVGKGLLGGVWELARVVVGQPGEAIIGLQEQLPQGLVQAVLLLPSLLRTSHFLFSVAHMLV